MQAMESSNTTKKLPPISSFEGTILEHLLHFVYCLIGFIVAVCIIPFLLPVSLMFRFYRHFLIHKIKQDHGKDGIDVVSSEDSLWLQDSPTNRAVITTVMAMHGEGDINTFREAIDKKLINVKDPDNPDKIWFPKVKQYPSQILHRYVWIPEKNFDMEEHVLVHDKCMPETNKELQTIVGNISSKPLPANRSPWQFILIRPNEKTPREYCIVFRVHHSMADGISLVRLLFTQIVDNPPDVTVRPRPGFGSSGFILRALKAVFEGPYIAIKEFLYPADHHILHGPSLSGHKLVAWSKSIDLDLIKSIKNITGTTVNDVLVSCLSGAFRTYFQENSSNPPKDILAYIPVDLRNPKSKPKLDNQFVLVFLRLATDVDDPLKLLDITRRRMSKIKSSAEPLVNSLIMKYCMARLPNWLTQMTFDMFSRKCTMVLSNVPGYQTKLSVAGELINDIVFWPPQRGNVGLGVSILSYGNEVRIGVQSDRALMSNPIVLVQMFIQEVNKLSDSLKLN